jgi:hypothetical protein
MAVNGHGGGTPLERLRTHYERTRMRCTACGYVDDDGEWTASTTGRAVTYRHVCPSCGTVDDAVIRL